jgi:N-acetylglucosamine-6-phosphate deacetylase
VTDALRPAGTDVTESYLGEKIPENRVIIEDGVAKLPDRSSFAGSIATSAMLLERGVNHYGLPLADVVTMLTKTPATILGLTDRGVIENGYRADVVLFDKSYQVTHVLLGGKQYV